MRRPPGRKTGRPISKALAAAVVNEFRQFLRWLNRAKEWQWTRPHDSDMRPVRIRLTPEEKALRGPIRVSTFAPGQLAVLWGYATPWERVLMALALNRGFGRAEIGTLRLDEVFLPQRHPYAEVPGLSPADGAGSWVRRVRGKTEVYAEWRLFDGAVPAMVSFIAPCRKGAPRPADGPRP